MSIIMGILITAGGALLVVQHEWFLNNFGRIAWFEEKFGTEGGSRFGYKLIGILFLIVGIITMTGSGPVFMRWILSPLLKYNLPQ
jgi:hypothetical protein